MADRIYVYRVSPLGKISLERGEIPLTGKEISLYKQPHADWPGMRVQNMTTQAIFNTCQNNKIIPASGMLFS